MNYYIEWRQFELTLSPGASGVGGRQAGCLPRLKSANDIGCIDQTEVLKGGRKRGSMNTLHCR